MPTESEFLLKEAVAHIKNLTHQSEIMHARLEMFDDMMAVFYTRNTGNSQGVSMDLVYEIEKFLAKPKEEVK